MKQLFGVLGFVMAIVAAQSHAAVECNGKIKYVYKWHYFENVSIVVELTGGGVTPWIGMPTKADESMALMAFAADKPVQIYWTSADITSCSGGWANNRSLDGFFLISK